VIRVSLHLFEPAACFIDRGKVVNSAAHSSGGGYLRRGLSALLAVGIAVALVMLGGIVAAPAALAASVQPTVGLGTATRFAVLDGTTVTNTGSSVISGDLGVSPGAAVTGFPPGVVINGSIHAADAVALQANPI
jgi:hypothetical protein